MVLYSDILFIHLSLFCSGSISRNELRSLCYDISYYLSDDELAWAWTIMDKDGSGHIDYREFADWWKMSSRFEHLKILNDQHMILVCQVAEIYRLYDVANQGTLNRTQCTALCQDLIREGIIDTNAHQACQFDEIDRGQDGRIHFNELIVGSKILVFLATQLVQARNNRTSGVTRGWPG